MRQSSPPTGKHYLPSPATACNYCTTLNSILVPPHFPIPVTLNTSAPCLNCKLYLSTRQHSQLFPLNISYSITVHQFSALWVTNKNYNAFCVHIFTNAIRRILNADKANLMILAEDKTQFSVRLMLKLKIKQLLASRHQAIILDLIWFSTPSLWCKSTQICPPSNPCQI